MGTHNIGGFTVHVKRLNIQVWWGAFWLPDVKIKIRLVWLLVRWIKLIINLFLNQRITRCLLLFEWGVYMIIFAVKEAHMTSFVVASKNHVLIWQKLILCFLSFTKSITIQKSVLMKILIPRDNAIIFIFKYTFSSCLRVIHKVHIELMSDFFLLIVDIEGKLFLLVISEWIDKSWLARLSSESEVYQLKDFTCEWCDHLLEHDFDHVLSELSKRF